MAKGGGHIGRRGKILVLIFSLVSNPCSFTSKFSVSRISVFIQHVLIVIAHPCNIFCFIPSCL